MGESCYEKCFSIQMNRFVFSLSLFLLGWNLYDKPLKFYNNMQYQSIISIVLQNQKQRVVDDVNATATVNAMAATYDFVWCWCKFNQEPLIKFVIIKLGN